MTEGTPEETDLKPYEVVGADTPGNTPADRLPWKRQAIYHSAICVAVHLSVIDPDLGEAEVVAAKIALFRYLRQVHQAVMDHGIVLPLAAVIERPGGRTDTLLGRALPGWGSDQSWHRGGFTLYVEKGKEDVRKRLRDLLNPTAKAMDLSKVKDRDPEWFASALDEAIGKSRGTDDATRIKRDLMRLCAADLRHPGPAEGDRTTFPELGAWRTDRLNETMRLANERTGS